MRIGILGSGLMGGKLGTLFARAGHDVVFSYSHERSKLEGAGATTPAEARGRERRARRRRMPTSCCSPCTGVAWTTCWRRRAISSGKVLVTCSLPMNADDTGLVVAHTSSGAEELAKKARGARVVSAFGTVPSEVLFAVFEATDGRSSAESRLLRRRRRGEGRRSRTLIRDVGFDPVDAGPLEVARYSEPFTLLIAKLAYEPATGRRSRTGSSGTTSGAESQRRAKCRSLDFARDDCKCRSLDFARDDRALSAGRR